METQEEKEEDEEEGKGAEEEMVKPERQSRYQKELEESCVKRKKKGSACVAGPE